MILTYGGQPLLFDDRGHGQEFLDRWLSLEMLASQVAPLGKASTRTNERDTGSVGLPVPNLSEPPAPRINALWWPTGASRWARGWFLADTVTKDAVVAQAHAGGNTALPFVASLDANQTFEADLYLLPPRRITAAGDATNNLWLLELVDERYWWQFRDGPTPTVTLSTTWASLISTYGSSLGVSIQASTIDAAFLGPDPHQLQRHHDSIPVILDAIATSVGLRVVRRPDGSVLMQSFDDASVTFLRNINDYTPWDRIAGGTIATTLGFANAPGDIRRNVVPGSVRVVFPRAERGIPCGDPYSVSVAADAYVSETTALDASSEYVVFSTAYADYTSGSLDNSSELSALAAAIAAAYYGQFKEAYDHAWTGIKRWDVSAFDDYVLYAFGVERENPLTVASTLDGQNVETSLSRSWDRLLVTRTHSLPHNHGVDQQLQQGVAVYLGIRWGKVKAGGSQDANSGTTGHNCPYAPVNPCDDCDGTNPDTAVTHNVILPARDEVGHKLAEGDVIAYAAAEDCQWVCVSDYSGAIKARWIRFQIDNVSGLTATDASVSATVAMYSDGPDPGASVTVYNLPSNNTGNYVFAGDDDDYGYAMYRPEDDRYYIWQMECA